MSRERSKGKSRKHQVKRSQMRSFRFITGVSVAMLIMVCYGAFTSYAKNQVYLEQELQLMAAIEEEQQRTIEIEEFKEYAQTDEYVIEVAREKLNMAFPEEVIFVPMD